MSGGRAGPLNFEFEIAGRKATWPATSEEKPADFTVLRNPPRPPGPPIVDGRPAGQIRA
jgi:hypothetical protein